MSNVSADEIRKARGRKNWHLGKDKYNAQKRDRYRSNPEWRQRRLEYDRRWRAENPEKYEAQLNTKYGSGLRFRFRVFARDEFKCRYCGRSGKDVVLHVDHIHPSSKGGRTTMDNCITACAECNLGKSDMVLTNRLLEVVRDQRAA